jgi:hypothetical protein
MGLGSVALLLLASSGLLLALLVKGSCCGGLAGLGDFLCQYGQWAGTEECVPGHLPVPRVE